jgi:hypothetical protein
MGEERVGLEERVACGFVVPFPHRRDAAAEGDARLLANVVVRESGPRKASAGEHDEESMNGGAHRLSAQ